MRDRSISLPIAFQDVAFAAGATPILNAVNLAVAAGPPTVLLGPNDEIRIFMRFRGFFGKYVMHCHNVVHEDHSMMIRYDVVP